MLCAYKTHKHPKVKAWLEDHPARFHPHFTPTSASWLNPIVTRVLDLHPRPTVGWLSG